MLRVDWADTKRENGDATEESRSRARFGGLGCRAVRTYLTRKFHGQHRRICRKLGA